MLRRISIQLKVDVGIKSQSRPEGFSPVLDGGPISGVRSSPGVAQGCTTYALNF